MSTEQTQQRLGFAEGVVRELQDQLHLVSARHQAAHEAFQTIHQPMSLLCSRIDARSRIRLVEPKGLMPDRLGTKSSPSWRTWSYLARDFVGLVHTVLKQAMKNAENKKQMISVSNFQDYWRVERNEPRVATFLDCAGLKEKHWKYFAELNGNGEGRAALCDALAAGRSLDYSKQVLCPPKVTTIDDFSHAVQAWEPLEQRHWERTGDQLPKDFDLIFFSPCVPYILRKS